MKTKLLLVEDDPDFRPQFAASLGQEGYKVVEAEDREEAERIWGGDPTLRLALVDLRMPDRKYSPNRSGLVLIEQLAKREDAAVAAITAHDGHENLVEVSRARADGFISKSGTDADWLAQVDLLAEWVRKGSALKAYARSLELRNPYTYGHCGRVKEYARALIPFLSPDVNGRNFNLAACLIGASIHDIGKIGFPDAILIGTRLGLTQEEQEVIRSHSVAGSRMLRQSGPVFERAAEVILYHHRWFGESSAYNPSDYPATDPDGGPVSRGNSIPIEARVVAACDSLDAVLSDRPYRPGRPLQHAIDEMRKGKGAQFCPIVVDAVERLHKEGREQMEEIRRHFAPPLTARLTLAFGDRRLTPGRLVTLCGGLRDIYVPDGPAIDRLAISSLRGPDLDENLPAVVELQGTDADVCRTFETLKARMDSGKSESAPQSMRMILPNAMPVVHPPEAPIPGS